MERAYKQREVFNFEVQPGPADLDLLGVLGLCSAQCREERAQRAVVLPSLAVDVEGLDAAEETLVERFDIEPFPDFSVK